MALCRSIRCSSVHGDLGIRLIWSPLSPHLKERSPRQNWSCLWKFRCWALPSNGFSNDHWALIRSWLLHSQPGKSVQRFDSQNISATHLATAPDSSVSGWTLARLILSTDVHLHGHPSNGLHLAIGRWSDLAPSLASGESVQRYFIDSCNSSNCQKQ